MNHQLLAFQNISFTYETGLTPIVKDLTVQFKPGWTGVVGVNGAGKTTLLELAAGLLEPTQGKAVSQGTTFYCPQRMDDLPDSFNQLIDANDGDAWRIKSALNIESDWVYRWETLSFGERKRAQLGTMLWRQPDIIAVDEPANHLDSDARRMVGDTLKLFKGVALLVSHDRELLDNLCTQCLFIESGESILRPGNYSEGVSQAQMEQAHERDNYLQVKQELSKLKRSAGKHREGASKAHKRRSKRGIAIGDHDAKAKLNKARVSGKDGTSGKLLNQMQGKIWQTSQRLNDINIKKTYDSGIWISGSKSSRNTLFTITADELPLGDARYIRFPDLSMKPDDRIAVTGFNGSGKSTLIRYVLKHLNIDSHRLIYMAQEMSIQESRQIKDDIQGLSNEDKGTMMTIVSRLGSRPARLLESELLSPGELRKCLLAMGIAQTPHLIIMDEPTNHLDLPSIECLESALNDCPCGLLLISHDLRLLSRLTQINWRINPVNDERGHTVLTVE